MKNIKKLLLISCTTLILTTMGGCTKSSNDDFDNNTATKTELTYNAGTEIALTDTSVAYYTEQAELLQNIFEPLCTIDKYNEPIPAGAESWTISDDGLTYTFYLRKDAKWSDGSNVTANDYKYNWMRTLAQDEDPYSNESSINGIKGAKDYQNGTGSYDDVCINILDDYTLQVELEYPNLNFLNLISQIYYVPLKASIVENNANWYTSANNYITNGPFTLASINEDKYVLQKNPYYWDADNVKLEKINFLFESNAENANTLFEDGSIDVSNRVSSTNIKELEKQGLIRFIPEIGAYNIIFNISGNDKSVEALNNTKVRQAINLAIDKNAIAQSNYFYGYTPADSIIPTGLYGLDGKQISGEYYGTASDIEKAKKLLEEAGYPNGDGIPTLEYLYPDEDKAHIFIAKKLQEDISKIGINIELKGVSFDELYDALFNKDFNMIPYMWGVSYLDPILFLDGYVTDSDLNDPGYSNKEFDTIIEAATTELSREKRESLIKEAEQIIMNDVPLISLLYLSNSYAVQKNVKNLEINQITGAYFKNTYIE